MYKKKCKLLRLFETNDINEALSDLFDIFAIKGKELYLVGGCVRDLLLEREPKDYDLCTNATPEELVKIFTPGDRYSIIETGIKHGTITLHDREHLQFFEITTYRIDGKYSDARHPDKVTFTPSLEEDLKRRDFTINSFAYDLNNEELIMLDESYLRDIEHGIIRAVGNPEDRFKEDALRMLRCIRFSAQLNCSIAKDTYEAIKNNAELISNISEERIRDELTKILMSDNPQAMEYVAITGLEKHALNSSYISDMLYCKHDSPWHYADIFHHTIDVVKRVPKTFVLRWSAFFHDIGKPCVKVLKEGCTDHYTYHGHQDASCLIANTIMDKLKFSNEQKDLIYKFVKYHDCKLVEYKNSKFKNVLVDIGIDNFEDYMKLRLADSSAHKLIANTKNVIDYIDEIWKRFDNTIIKNEALTLKDLKVNGYDMMQLNLKGKQIGDMLNYLLGLVLEDDSLNNKETLLKLAKEKQDEQD